MDEIRNYVTRVVTMSRAGPCIGDAPYSVILRRPRAARASKDARRSASTVTLRGPLRGHLRVTDKASMPLEILHRALVLLRGGAAGAGADIAAPAGARILLARIEPVFAGRQFANHGGCFP